MPAPLIVAGAKVAGKAVAKKMAAKQAAKLAAKAAAKKTAEGVAKKTAEKVGTEAIKGGAKNIPIKRPPNKFMQGYQQSRDISDKVQQAQDLANAGKSKKEENQKPKQKQNILDKIFSKGQTNLPSDPNDTTPRKFDYRRTLNEKVQTTNENSQAVPKQSKGWYNAAMFMAIWKDIVEIAMNLLALGWLSPFLSFFPTIVLTFILFVSGKKSTLKIITYFLTLVIDLLIPGVNTLPLTTIATFIIFHIKSDAVKKLDKNNLEKGIGIIKSFIKLK